MQRPNRKVEPARSGELCRAENLLQPLHLRLGGRDNKHVVAVSNRVQLVAHAADVAAEPLDRLQRQMTMHARGVGLNLGHGRHGKTTALCQYRRHGVKTGRLLDALYQGWRTVRR